MKGSTKKPNVVFIIADDHRYEAIRSSGNAVVRTPTLDALSAEGTALEGMHIFGGLTGAVCAPSRACVNTGRPIFESMIGSDVSVWEHSVNIRPDVPLMPQTFRDGGYHTYAVGKWHNDKGSFARSFAGGDKLFFYGMSDHNRVPVQPFDPEGRYPQERERISEAFSTELFTDAAVDFIRKHDRERPFYLYVAYTAPHDPRTAPEPYAGMYDPEAIPLPSNFMEGHPFDTGDMEVRDEKLARLPRSEAEIRRHMADYYAMITHMDAQIGRVVSALKDQGIYEETIIVYTADHGIAIGQHGLMGKQNVYDHSIRIPFIMRGPGVPQGLRISALASNIDMFPTLAELCGLRMPSGAGGISFVPLLEGRERLRPVVCTAYRDVQRMVKDGRWKLIRYYHSPVTDTGTDRIQLFDLEADPWETRDVSDDPANEPHIRRLAGELQRWMEEGGDIMKEVPVLPA
ncbi:sulfatase-like hydrolase/transferase [Paenibacillus sp. VCA1]|uniref:sulfatase-like hydrolase/transferase n=1 Tax=Paenibacillus sp. VCA1 TaxID=3039148 RepID=UPI0028725FFD|nr:sulfatase-like hydrolase/transferase [Paenibacillus sp. VCA1]MDR9856281.1 sulfatase-like hydrolase/transferase [Paenibacillus sp. VCA1]